MTQSPTVPPGSPTSAGAPQRFNLVDVVRGLLPLVVVGGSIFAYVEFGNRPPSPARAESLAAVPGVVTVPAELFAESIGIQVEGVARPARRVSVAAEVQGRIKFKAPECEEATFIQQGDLLFEIDPTDYDIAVRRATNELAQTENALKEWEVERANTLEQIKLADEDLKLATRDLERLRSLVVSGGAAAADVDQAQRTELITRNTLLTLRNQIRLLDARYNRAVSARDLQQVAKERAERDLARTKVYAPCNGTVVTEDVEQDGYVQAGTTMVVINDTTVGEVICQLEVDDMYWLWGTRARESSSDPTMASYYDFPTWPVVVEFPFQDLVCQWDGELTRFGGTGLDPATRTVPCQVTVPRPRDGRLHHVNGAPTDALIPPPLTVGMFVRVRAQVRPFMPLLSLPPKGVRAGSVTWVAAAGKLKIVPLQIARRLPDRVLVYPQLDGLQPGDEIVVSPLAFVNEGMAVQKAEKP